MGVFLYETMPPMMFTTPRPFAHRRARCAPCAMPCPVPSIFKFLLLAFFLGPLVAPVIKLFFVLASIFLHVAMPISLVAMLCSTLEGGSPCDVMRCMKKCTRGQCSRGAEKTVR